VSPRENGLSQVAAGCRKKWDVRGFHRVPPSSVGAFTRQKHSCVLPGRDTPERTVWRASHTPPPGYLRRWEVKNEGNSRDAPPMLRNCSSALEESTAAALTGRSVVSGRPVFVCVSGGGVTTAVVRVAPIALRAVALAALILTGFPVTANFAEIDPAATVVCAMHVDAMAPGSGSPSLWSVPASAPAVKEAPRG
jgi:hypothetical protein